MLEILFWLVLIVIAFILGTRVFLQGQDLSVFDRSIDSSMRSGEPSEEHYNSIDSIAGLLQAGNENKDRKTTKRVFVAVLVCLRDTCDFSEKNTRNIKNRDFCCFRDRLPWGKNTHFQGSPVD